MTEELDVTLRQWLVSDDQSYQEQKDSEIRIFRFEVPISDWTENLMPVRGTDTPIELGGSGAVLARFVNYREIPGYVVCILTCGWAGVFWFDSLTHVDVRTVTTREAPTTGSDGTTQLTGPVTGEEETQKYDVFSPPYQETVTYAQITITSLVTLSQLTTITAALGNFGDRNTVQVVFNGITYQAETVAYAGYGSQDVDASNSPLGVQTYRLTILLIAGPRILPLTVDQYIYTKTLVRLEVVTSAGVKVGDGRAPQWVRGDDATPVTVRGEFDFNTALGALP